MDRCAPSPPQQTCRSVLEIKINLIEIMITLPVETFHMVTMSCKIPPPINHWVYTRRRRYFLRFISDHKRMRWLLRYYKADGRWPVCEDHLPGLEHPQLWHPDCHQVPNFPKNFYLVLAGNRSIGEPGCVRHGKGQQKIVFRCLN